MFPFKHCYFAGNGYKIRPFHWILLCFNDWLSDSASTYGGNRNENKNQFCSSFNAKKSILKETFDALKS